MFTSFWQYEMNTARTLIEAFGGTRILAKIAESLQICLEHSTRIVETPQTLSENNRKVDGLIIGDIAKLRGRITAHQNHGAYHYCHFPIWHHVHHCSFEWYTSKVCARGWHGYVSRIATFSRGCGATGAILVAMCLFFAHFPEILSGRGLRLIIALNFVACIDRPGFSLWLMWYNFILFWGGHHVPFRIRPNLPVYSNSRK